MQSEDVFIGIVVSVGKYLRGIIVNQPPISKHSRLRRRETNVTARAAIDIDIGNTAKETVKVNETIPVPAVVETEPAKKYREKN